MFNRQRKVGDGCRQIAIHGIESKIRDKDAGNAGGFSGKTIFR